MSGRQVAWQLLWVTITLCQNERHIGKMSVPHRVTQNVRNFTYETYESRMKTAHSDDVLDDS